MSKLSKEEFQEKINKRYPDEDITIIDYVQLSSAGTYQCNKCKNIFSIYRMSDLLRKKHCCNHCYYGKGQGTETLKKKDKAKKYIEDSKNLEFISFGYNSRLYKVTITYKCLKCGNIISKQLPQFEKNPNCSFCSYGAKKMDSQGLSALLPEGYTLLGEYQGADTKVLFRHSCGFIWKTTPHNLRSGCGCPKCSRKISKGEQKIRNFFDKNHILYEAEKSFEWSEHKRYDFYLPSYNLVIEYMGGQHYKEVPHFHRSLAEEQANDKWKKEQALAHSLAYLEIPYTDFGNLEVILAQRLNIEQTIIDG